MSWNGAPEASFPYIKTGMAKCKRVVLCLVVLVSTMVGPFSGTFRALGTCRDYVTKDRDDGAKHKLRVCSEIVNPAPGAGNGRISAKVQTLLQPRWCARHRRSSRIDGPARRVLLLEKGFRRLGVPVELLGKSAEELREYVASLGERPFRAAQLYHAMYAERRFDFSAMSNIPAALRERLASEARITPPRIQRRFASTDGSIRYLFAIGAPADEA